MSAIRVPQSNSTLEGMWHDRIGRWKASGLPVHAFCVQEGLSEPSFYSWRQTLAARDEVATASSAPAFVPVHVFSVTAQPVLELVLRAGHMLQTPVQVISDCVSGAVGQSRDTGSF